MKSITIITYGYPNPATPTLCPFIEELVLKWQNCGLKTQVINPLTPRNYYKCKRKFTEKNDAFPLYFEFRFLKTVPLLRGLQRRLAELSFQKAIEKCLIFDDNRVLYAHFLNAGCIASAIGSKYGYPVFCAFGESTLWSIQHRNRKSVIACLNSITGFISVSPVNTDILISSGFAPREKILTLPNGVDLSKFYKMDKDMCRTKLGFLSKDVIGIFVGHFIERKGPLRVAEAVKDIKGLKMIYVGQGEQQIPFSDNTLHCGPIEHEKLRDYLSAADFFILPTLAEGCCNAILEAMACGLPIISSTGRFNDCILDDAVAIRVDPLNISALHDAVLKLKSDLSLRRRMSEAAVAKAAQYSIENRSVKIAKFMNVGFEGYERGTTSD